MFNYISGTVEELAPNLAVIDCGGVGFRINTSAYTAGTLRMGERAKLYTYVHIREDLFDIYGFSTKSEKRCFELLIGVSGVGPKAAVSILSTGTPENFVMSVISGDERAITAAPGVGKKIAQRVILELKDKLGQDIDTVDFGGGIVPVAAAGGEASARSEAAAALAVLGYAPAEINAALKKIDVSDMSTEAIVKAVLKQMVK